MIRPPYEYILNKLLNEDNVGKINCYATILKETEGVEISSYIIEKEIKKETNEDKLIRLNTALKIINEESSVKEEKAN